MSRNREIYQIWSVYIGGNNSSGYNQINSAGILNNDFPAPGTNHNLITPITRVQSANYSVNINRVEVKQLGKLGLIARPIIDPPTVNLSLDYLQNGVYNEFEIGFNTNYTIEIGQNSGLARYTNNTGVFILSGFVDRSDTRQIDLGSGLFMAQHPFISKDKRNLYIAVAPEGQDLNNDFYYSGIDPNSPLLHTYSFGNCYLTNYSTNASVGNFPKCNVSYICENMQINMSGSGVLSPYLDPKTRLPTGNVLFTLPTTFLGSGLVSALLPGDITMNFTALPELTGVSAIFGTGFSRTSRIDIPDLGVDFTDIKIQSYDINLPLNREALNSLGYRLPVDRRITFPSYVDLTVNTIVGDEKSGSIANYLNNNDDYNIAIKIAQPRKAVPQGTAVQYDFKRAKFESISYSSDIGPSKTANIGFRVELDSENFTEKGFYMSGLLNINQTGVSEGFLIF